MQLGERYTSRPTQSFKRRRRPHPDMTPPSRCPTVRAAVAVLVVLSPVQCAVSAFVVVPRTSIGGLHVSHSSSSSSSSNQSSSSVRGAVPVRMAARGGRRVHNPDEEHEEIIRYLARSEARAGGGLGFEYPDHPPDPHHRRHKKERDGGSGGGKKNQRYREYDWPSHSSDPALRDLMLSERTMSSAVAIVPPEEAWDSLQRARHLVRDPTYHRWPPSIRLFHPFAPRMQLPSAATAIAAAVERHNLDPFEVTLDRLLILPHFEVLEEQVDASAEMVRRHTGEAGEERRSAEEERRREIRAQIEEEERSSRIKMLRRREMQRRRRGLPPLEVPEEEEEEDDDRSSGDESPQDVVDRQRSERSEFNGPCVVCLEPNDESRARLERLREVLRSELFGPYDAFSASSGVSSTDRLPRIVEERHGGGGRGGDGDGDGDGDGEDGADAGAVGATFRPVLTLGRFPTVTAAVNAAKKLQALWEPLTFTVNDLSLISRTDPEGAADASSAGAAAGDGAAASAFSVRRIRGTEHESESALLSTRGRYGCDAMVALVGAEAMKDAVGDDELLDLLMSEAGESGGGAEDTARLDYEALLSMSEAEEDIRRRQARVRWDGGVELVDDDSDSKDGGWEDWLLDDEEWDEGATIVIGRTQFFMGEARQYVGMPAASTIDGKDRVLGEGVSGAARRKGAVHRKGDRWKDGDFGRKEKDYLR